MIKALTLIVVTFLTFSVFAINNKTTINGFETAITENVEVVKLQPIQANNFAILKKANLSEASLLKVVTHHIVSCSECSVRLNACLAVYTWVECRQDFVDCRELCF
ncbi:MAG: hypothetical protein JKY19_08745 [Alcanivoracaceae bacterium]|nr:hypothetical protein [Alcanivoracaceae bacterium]